MNESTYKRLSRKVGLVVVGNVIYAMGVNLAINPVHFYSSGFTGIAQLIRLFLLNVLHLPEIPGPVSYTHLTLPTNSLV